MLDILAICVSVLAMLLTVWNSFRGFPWTPTLKKDQFYIQDRKFDIDDWDRNEYAILLEAPSISIQKNEEGEMVVSNDEPAPKVEHEHEWEFITSEHVRYRRCFSCELEEPDVVEHKHDVYAVSEENFAIDDLKRIRLVCQTCDEKEELPLIQVYIMLWCKHRWTMKESKLVGNYIACAICNVWSEAANEPGIFPKLY